MISNGPARTFTRNAVEAWLFRLSDCDWEQFINKDHLKIGRTFYRDGVLSSLDIQSSQIIVTRKINREETYSVIEWNEKNGIRVFRLSSELFQHKNNHRVPDYDYDFALEHLTKIGELARKYNHRLTFHPGQFNVLASPHQRAYEQTLKELDYHATVFELMKMGKDSVMVIHGGGVYKDKEVNFLIK